MSLLFLRKSINHLKFHEIVHWRQILFQNFQFPKEKKPNFTNSPLDNDHSCYPNPLGFCIIKDNSEMTD